MSALGIFVCLYTVTCADGLNFLDLNVTETPKTVEVSLAVEPFASFETLEDDVLSLSQELLASLDGPVQQAILVLEDMDKERVATEAANREIMARVNAAVAAEGEGTSELKLPPPVLTEPEYIADFSFRICTRNTQGKVFDEVETKVSLGLSPKAGRLVVLKDERQQFAISFENLSKPAIYAQLLARLATPANTILKRPKDDAYIVDLYYSIDHVASALEADWRLADSPRKLRILRTLAQLERQEQLGTTYRYVESGEVKLLKSGHLRMTRELIRGYHQVSKDLTSGKPVRKQLEALVARAPAEAPILALLARDYCYGGKREQAYRMLRRLEPLITQDPRSASIYREIMAVREGERRKLLSRKKMFRESREAVLEIISPEEGDYVGGLVEVGFNLRGKRAPLIQVDLRVNDELRDSLQEPPNVLTFTPTGKRRHLELEVTAWFKNKTYARATLPVRYLYVAEQETVQLISLRTLVTKGGDRFVTDLEEQNFRIMEAGEQRPLIKFRRDTAPLRIAVLVDTSGSMAGEKLYRAQYAVNAFLKALKGEDTAAVYTFDHKVLKMARPTNSFSRLSPQLFTMRPQLTTSLHDAIMVAHDDLRDQEGTKVIIVLSDGNDSTSRTKADSIKGMLAQSNALVYPIILDRDSGMDLLGANHLTELAEITGSIVTELDEIRHLEKAFGRIYEELKAFYFVDYYSSQADFSLAGVKVKIKGRSGKARFRQHLDDEMLYTLPASVVVMPTAPPGNTGTE